MVSKRTSLYDRVGVKPEFTYRGVARHRTFFGGIVTIILDLLMLGGIIFLGRDIILRRNPNVYTGRISTENPGIVQLSHQNFPFYIAIEDPSHSMNYFFNEGIFKIKAIHSRQVRTIKPGGIVQLNQTLTDVKLVTCQSDHFIGYEEVFKNLNYKNAYCIEKNQNVSLQGFFSSDIYDIFRIQVFQCQNNSLSQNNCLSQQIIDSKLKNSFIAFQYGDLTSNPSNFSYPLESILGDEAFVVSNQFQKKISVELIKITSLTDKGFLLEDTHEQSHIMANKPFKENFLPFSPKENYFFQLTIRLGKFVEIHKRSYIKVQNILAQVGGLYNLFYIISQTIVRFFTVNLFYLEMLNRNFDSKNNIPFIESKPSTFSLKKNNFVEDSNINLNNSSKLVYNMINENYDKSKDLEYRIEKRRSEEIEKLQRFFIIKNCSKIPIPTFKENLLFTICNFRKKKKSDKFNLIMKGKKLLTDKLDINAVISLIFDFRKIKKVLFSDDQLNVLNQLANNNLVDVIREEFIQNYKSELEYVNLSQCINSLNNSVFSKKLNKRILAMCDQKIIKNNVRNII
jgi:hypothetical protein